MKTDYKSNLQQRMFSWVKADNYNMLQYKSTKYINMQNFTFNVNGIMFRPKKIIKEVAEDIKLDDTLFLERDEINRYDKYAVKVFYGTSWIGYVEKLYSQEVSELLDSNKEFNCNVLFVDADWGFDITDSGREVEFIEDITLIAEIKLE